MKMYEYLDEGVWGERGGLGDGIKLRIFLWIFPYTYFMLRSS